MNALTRASKNSERIGKILGETGIAAACATLSEGFCPLCKGRRSDIAVLPAGDEPTEYDASATINCQACKILWRAGLNPENGLDWIQYSQRAGQGMVLSLCINPPDGDGDDYGDEDWGDD